MLVSLSEKRILDVASNIPKTTATVRRQSTDDALFGDAKGVFEVAPKMAQPAPFRAREDSP